jgi:hypothetical protein
MRIRIQLLFEMMGICDRWFLDLPGPHLSLQTSIVSVHGPPRLYFSPLKVLNFDFNADQNSAFHSNEDRDPTSKKNVDPDLQPCLKENGLDLPDILGLLDLLGGLHPLEDEVSLPLVLDLLHSLKNKQIDFLESKFSY